MKKVAIYSRVSSEEQLKNFSLDDQEDRCEKFIHSQGWKLFKIYREEGISGFMKERPQIIKLLTDASNGFYDILVFYRIDRLSRNQRVFLEIIDELTKNNVLVKSVTESFDTTTSSGRLVLSLLSGFAEFERELIMERMSNGRIRSMKLGNWSGSTPYGYKLKNKKLTVYKKEAKTVKIIFDLFVNRSEGNNSTFYSVQSVINNLKIPTKYANQNITKKTSSTYWNKRTISSILENPVYTGKFTFKKYSLDTRANSIKKLRPCSEWVCTTVPKIIEENLFKKAQKIISKNRILFDRNKKSNYMLKGIIKCGFCGCTYSGCTNVVYENRYKRVYYRCNGKCKYFREKICKSSNITAYRIEDIVWKKIKEILKTSNIDNKWTSKSSCLTVSQNDLLEEYYRIKRVRERILKRCVNDQNIDRYNKFYTQIKERENSLFGRLNNLNNTDVVNVFNILTHKVPNSDMDKLSQAEKVKIVRLLVKKIVLSGDKFKIYCRIPLSKSLYYDERKSKFYPSESDGFINKEFDLRLKPVKITKRVGLNFFVNGNYKKYNLRKPHRTYILSELINKKSELSVYKNFYDIRRYIKGLDYVSEVVGKKRVTYKTIFVFAYIVFNLDKIWLYVRIEHKWIKYLIKNKKDIKILEKRIGYSYKKSFKPYMSIDMKE
ncbi:recombinase family protein [bacterium]|jgi:site-specific DNA recombinase|nr:recombinase family protein [bacterium]MBT4495493.1 recombinase family protein [bacterium]MBT4764305.1 recombinase family protein [bacterium]MBT5401675.1 recombinase family protein [bacterium]MBT5942149.1 recombinase family protein [bacterium]